MSTESTKHIRVHRQNSYETNSTSLCTSKYRVYTLHNLKIRVLIDLQNRVCFSIFGGGYDTKPHTCGMDACILCRGPRSHIRWTLFPHLRQIQGAELGARRASPSCPERER